MARWFAALLSIATMAAGGPALALGLGPAALHSGLGEPLRMTFPVTLQPDEEAGCVQVHARGDDLPAVLNTRASVLRSGSRIRIEISSAQPVNEPAIGLVVSVGCTSPVSREYVLFLDPPIVPPLDAATDRTAPVAAPVVAPSARRGVTGPRRAAARKANDGGAAGAAPTTRRRARAASAASAAGSQSSPAPQSAPSRSTRQAPSGVAKNGSTRDRLTVAPAEPPAGPATAPSSAPAAAQSVAPSAPPAVTPPPVAAAPSTAPATAPVTAPGAAATPAGAAIASGAVTAAATAPASQEALDAAARELALRRQQLDLQQQIKSMSDQIAALRVQTRALVDRNQSLQDAATSSTLIWFLIALAALAIIAAGWMAWRYAQLRRSVDGGAWWAGNTVNRPTETEPGPPETRGGLAPLDAGTRLVQRPQPQLDPRTSAVVSPPLAAVSNVERPRQPAVRNAAYPAAIDTDFTVSDIEAAMATVRTVSPARDAPRPNVVEDSDFAPLGGPTLPSPFAEPPPAARKAPPERTADGGARFVDREIPPRPAAPSAKPAAQPPAQPATATNGATTATQRPAPAADEGEPLDFKLDIPMTFDPLASDSLKTTVIDRAPEPEAVDFELPASSTPLDFELPSTTDFTGGADDDSFDGGDAVRHGATALDDLFPSLGGPGADTILDLDERDESPLSTTEVDRLMTTAIEGTHGETSVPSTRARLARFADLMNQVDDAAAHDPLRAIAHLRQYVLRDEQIPTLLWLRLFELYKAVDKKPVYEALAEHFSRRYHRSMVGWHQTLADRVPQTPLSAMGPIDREIEALWGKEEGLERIRALLCDRDQDDAIVFNAVLQRDLLDAAKVFPPNAESLLGNPAPG